MFKAMLFYGCLILVAKFKSSWRANALILCQPFGKDMLTNKQDISTEALLDVPTKFLYLYKEFQEFVSLLNYSVIEFLPVTNLCFFLAFKDFEKFHYSYADEPKNLEPDFHDYFAENDATQTMRKQCSQYYDGTGCLYVFTKKTVRVYNCAKLHAGFF
jgi:hypothetical protein